MTSALVVGVIAMGTADAPAAESCATQAAVSSAPPALPPDLVSAAKAAGRYPTFCSIPRIPVVRSAAAYKAAVGQLRLAERQLVNETAPNTWSLSDTDAFATAGKAAAAPPPPITTPAEGDTDAFLKAMRERATPPPRARH